MFGATNCPAVHCKDLMPRVVLPVPPGRLIRIFCRPHIRLWLFRQTTWRYVLAATDAGERARDLYVDRPPW